MLLDNESITFNPKDNSYDYSACSELSISDWIELNNLVLDYPIVSYEIATLEDALTPQPVIVPPAQNQAASSKLPIILCALGGVAVTATAVIIAKSRLKTKLLKAAL